MHPAVAPLLAVVHLATGNGVHAAAQNHQAVGLDPTLGFFAHAEPQISGQAFRQSGAACQQLQAAQQVQPLCLPLHVLSAGAVKEVNTLLFPGAKGIQLLRRDYLHRHIALQMQQIRHPAFRHRLEGILTEHALIHRNPVNIMDAVHGDSVHARQRRNEGKALFSAAVQHGAEFRADVSPEGRVGFLVNAADVGGNRPLGNGANHVVGLPGGQVTGRRAKYQNLLGDFLPEVHPGIGGYPGSGTRRGKLHARVQCPGEVIGNDQQFYHVS